MAHDRRINPADIAIGDIITSDPRRDYTVADLDVHDFGDVTIYSDDGQKVFVRADQTVAVRR